MQVRHRAHPLMFRVTGGLLATAMLAGCAVLPEPRQLGVPLPDRYSSNVTVPAAPAVASWWERFNDPELEALIATGIAQSPTIEAARAQLNSVEQQARAVGVRFEGDATASVSENSEGSGSRALGLGLDLLPFGRRTADLALAEARLNRQRQAFLDTQRVFVADVTSEYVQLRYLQALLGLRFTELGLARDSLDAAVRQAELSAATELDVLDARAFVADVQAEIPATRSLIVASQRRLATLLGLPPHDIPPALERRGDQPVPIGISDIGVPADLVRHRPDVREAEHAYEAALAELGIARANRYPNLSLDGVIRAAVPGDTVRSASVGLSLPVFSQPALAAEEDAAGWRVHQAYVNWQNAVISAVHEVERSLAAIAFASERLSAAQRAERLQERRASLLREAQSASGDFTIEDVIDADQTLARSRERTAESARVLASEYINLWTALGASLPEESALPDRPI